MEFGLLIASTLMAAYSIWKSRRGHPLWAVDPRGLMALVLWLNAVGFAAYRIYRGTYPYVFGFDERLASEATALLILGQGGFLIGTLIPSSWRRVRVRHPKRSSSEDSGSLIVVLSGAVLITGLFQYAKLVALGGSAILSYRYGETQYEVSAPAVLNAAYICVPTLLLLILAWARSRRRLLDARLLGIVIYAMAPAVVMGARRDAILCVFAFLLGHAIRSGRTRLRNVMVVGVFAVVSSYVLGLSRSGASLAFGDRVAALNERAAGGEDPLDLRTVTTTSGIPIMTAALSVFPANAPHTAGRTYLESIVNVAFPRFITGGHMFTPPALTFRNLFYADVTNHGMDYSLAAEAYQNFGMVGPFVVSLCLGALLQFSFRRASAGSRLWLLLHFQLTAAALWAIRSDSNTTIKLMVYGGIWVVLLFALARRLSPRIQDARLRPDEWFRATRYVEPRPTQPPSGGR